MYSKNVAGKIQSETVSHEDSLPIARIKDEIRRQIEVKFDDWILPSID